MIWDANQSSFGDSLYVWLRVCLCEDEEGVMVGQSQAVSTEALMNVFHPHNAENLDPKMVPYPICYSNKMWIYKNQECPVIASLYGPHRWLCNI